MAGDLSVLVCGIDETASAVARRLFAEGYAVCLYRATAPQTLRRRMCFADAWYDGYALLDGVEARRADVHAEFQLGLQTREFIPLLRGRYGEALERWPWDVIIAAREDKEPLTLDSPKDADLTIGLGADYEPGADCDIAIDTDGPDPGAIRRIGAPTPLARISRHAPVSQNVPAPAPGLFRAAVSIGTAVEAGAPIGRVDDIPVLAPVSGRMIGVARKEQAVLEGAPVAEISLSPGAPVAGVGFVNQLVSRGVSFAIEMESEGFEPFSFEDWF
jgi:xanthine dehydrogenase accessory factor